jgi:hypothetical protein
MFLFEFALFSSAVVVSWFVLSWFGRELEGLYPFVVLQIVIGFLAIQTLRIMSRRSNNMTAVDPIRGNAETGEDSRGETGEPKF